MAVERRSEQKATYREWAGSPSDMQRIGSQLQTALEKLLPQSEAAVKASRMYTERLAELKSSDPQSAARAQQAIDEMLADAGEGLSLACKATLGNQETVSGSLTAVLTEVDPEEVAELRLSGPERFGGQPSFGVPQDAVRVDLHFQKRPWQSSQPGVELVVSCSDRQWVLATRAACVEQIERRARPWWRFLRRPLFAVLLSVAVFIGSSLALTAWMRPPDSTSDYPSWAPLSWGFLFGFLLYYAWTFLVAQSMPSFELYPEGKEPQSARVIAATAGAVVTVSSLVLGVIPLL